MPVDDLNICVVQCELHWENVESNLQSVECLLKTVPLHADVVVLPEMFTTGFSMNAKSLAVKMDGDEVKKLKTWANQYSKALVGSLIVEENGNYYNRLLWVNPDGEIFKYDKKHLFTYANEQNTYTAGNEQLIVKYKGWKLACYICYDLRFPVWNRNVDKGYDVAIYVANWPSKRVEAWSSLLVARAIENQAYVIGVNRVGVDGNGISYSGGSVVLDCSGERLDEAGPNQKKILTAHLRAKKLNKYRVSFPVADDADEFKIL
ncbi:MAG: omega-amidase [Glaciecola sp.]|jgi:omega-amidase